MKIFKGLFLTFFSIGLVCNGLPVDERVDSEPRNYPPGTTICFDELIGCFSNSPPFSNSLNYLPVPPNVLKTEFLLYTRKNPTREQLLHYRDANTIKNSNFDTTLPLKIIVHGFDNNRDTAWLHDMRRAILNTDNVNVMIVGWGNGSAFPNYNNASANIRLVGRELGLLINLIRKTLYPTNPKALNVHCIGHSLGSHTCSYASNNADIRFNRITGMDPAGPLYEDTDPIVRTDPTDADFVDIMHTDAGSIFSASFGINMPSGHVDFYVNGGRTQPGCPAGLGGLIGGVFGGDPSSAAGCSHGRATEFFTESVTSKCPFIAYTCYSESDWIRGKCTTCANNKCAVMGYWADRYPGRGVVYLGTNPQAPYCGHHHIIELTISPDASKTAGELAIVFPNAGVDKSYKTLTTNDDDLKPNDVVRRIFVTQNDLGVVNEMTMKFNKKSKPLFGTDPNAPRVKFDKVNVHSLDLDEDYSQCFSNGVVIETNKTAQFSLRNGKC